MSSISGRLPVHVVLLLAGVVSLFPLYWLFLTSVSPTQYVVRVPPEVVPRELTVANYQRLFETTPIVRWLVNTVVIAGVITAFHLLFDSMAGYAFAKRRFPGKDVMFWLIVSTLTVPAQVTLIPVFFILRTLGLLDTYPGVILPGLADVFGIFLMKQYIQTLPTDLLHAARVDGASEWQVYRRIILPLSRPALAVLAIFTFQRYWNAFIFPLVILRDPAKYPVQVGLATLQGKVAALTSKGIRPDPSDPNIPSVAAICVYPNLVAYAVERTRGTGVKVAAVATSFPSGQSSLEVKLLETREVIDAGADEVDMVIDRGALLSGRYAQVYDEIVRVKEVCAGRAHLKVILETGELGTYDNVRRASLLAIAGGADFIKTSTGKLPSSATLPVTLCMLEAIRDVHEETGRVVGMKAAGGIRQAKQAVQDLVQVHETLGLAWLTPDRYRLGASTLLNDVLMQIRKARTGRYQNRDYFTVD